MYEMMQILHNTLSQIIAKYWEKKNYESLLDKRQEGSSSPYIISQMAFPLKAELHHGKTSL